jgi:hypothetical protein
MTTTCQLDHPFAIDKDVTPLDVTVDHSLSVQVEQTAKDLPQVDLDERLTELPELAQLRLH